MPSTLHESETSNASSSEESKSSATQATLDPATQEQPLIKDPQALVNAHDRVKAENRDLKQSMQELSAKLGVIEQTLGQIDEATAQQIKRQIAESEKLKAEKEENEQKLISKTIESQKGLYEPQIQQLEKSNLAHAQTIRQVFEEQALQQVFQTNNGSDFYAFKSLFPQHWKPEFIDIEDAFAPGGTRKKVKRFVKLDGSPITDEAGVELTISALLQQANKGSYGGPLRASFNDFNSATGDGFYQGASGPSDVKNPWTEQHWNLTLQGKILTENRSLAQQMAAQAGKRIG